jgi:hypothetical protein
MYVEEARVSVEMVKHLIYYPTEAWTLHLGEIHVNTDDIAKELQSIATLHGQEEYPVANSVRIRQSQTDWGASGSFGEYMIELSNNLGGGIGSVAAIAAIKAAMQKIKSWSSDPSDPESLTTSQACNLLKSHITLHYDVNHEELTETFSSASPGSGIQEFSFVAPNGTEYGGTVGELDGLPRCTRVWSKTATPLTRPAFDQTDPDQTPS